MEGRPRSGVVEALESRTIDSTFQDHGGENLAFYPEALESTKSKEERNVFIGDGKFVRTPYDRMFLCMCDD